MIHPTDPIEKFQKITIFFQMCKISKIKQNKPFLTTKNQTDLGNYGDSAKTAGRNRFSIKNYPTLRIRLKNDGGGVPP